MAREDLSAIAAFGLSSYAGSGSSAHGYIRYLTGWTGRFGPSMLLMPQDGDLTLIVPSAHDGLYLSESFPWVGQCYVESTGRYAALTRRLLLEAGVERVGLVGASDMPAPVHGELMRPDGGLKFLPADRLLDELRLVKDSDEIALHRQAACIADEMLHTLVDRLHHHRGPAWKLMADMEYAGRSLGAEIATPWLVTGQPADRPRYRLEENQRAVRGGDQVLVGLYVTYRGYWAHMLRMGSVGDPSTDYRRLYEAALTQHRSAAAQVVAGGNAHRIQAEADAAAERALPGSGNHPARFRHAHFLGLDYAEKPTALAFPQPANWSASGGAPAAAEVILRPGMVLEVHTNLGVEGVGFGTIGDVYLVGSAGPERLTTFPRDLFVA